MTLTKYSKWSKTHFSSKNLQKPISVVVWMTETHFFVLLKPTVAHFCTGLLRIYFSPIPPPRHFKNLTKRVLSKRHSSKRREHFNLCYMNYYWLEPIWLKFYLTAALVLRENAIVNGEK